MIAITGLIGSGKSFIANIVRSAGFDVLDADSLAHELYKENAELRKRIAENFGEEALAENGINRKYMANLVFNDEQKLELLESIVHPVLQREIEKRNPQFLEAAVLHKWPEFAKKMKEIWVIEADENVRKQRLLQRGMTEKEIEMRNNSQLKKWTMDNGQWTIIKNNGLILQNVLLKEHCTFKIGGAAKFFTEPKSVEELAGLLKIPGKVFILGGGSNVLFSDDGFDGLVIKIGKNFIAGKSLHSVIQEAAKAGLGGIEKLQGIPGTVGGAIYMNAGAHGQQISDCIKSVTSIAQNGKIITRTKEKCKFSYRSSIFKTMNNVGAAHRGCPMDNEIIISAEFEFVPMPKEVIDKNRKEVLKWRKEKQPLQYPNAGSIFKNPNNSQLKSAAFLIESCKFKGYRIGDAQVSELHANFIVNRGNASAKDVFALMEKIIEEVKKNHGVVLEPEIIYPPSSPAPGPSSKI